MAMGGANAVTGFVNFAKGLEKGGYNIAELAKGVASTTELIADCLEVRKCPQLCTCLTVG